LEDFIDLLRKIGRYKGYLEIYMEFRDIRGKYRDIRENKKKK